MTPSRMLDVLIVTSLQAEHDAVLAVETGAVAGRSWEPRTGPGGLGLSVRPYLSHDGGELKVGLTLVPWMGPESATGVLKALLSELRSMPRCIVSCGICTGRLGAVSLGDVIFADLVRVEDMPVWSLDMRWAWSSAQFTMPAGGTWLESRPLPLEAQADWMLMRLAEGTDPTNDPERRVRCPDWTSVVLHLRARGLLASKGLALSDAGRAEARELGVLHPDGLPEAPAWRVHLGPIEMTTNVMDSADAAARGMRARRSAIGVDLESSVAAALPVIAEAARCLVVRGVSDLGDGSKDDRYRSFAARAAAECALSFVRDRLGAATLNDVLDPGTRALPPNVSNFALLQARYTTSPFHGREDILTALRAWCAEGDPVRAHLVYAGGGMGKTRLAIELCYRLRRDGWLAGFVREPAPTRWFEGLWESERPVLMVIDDAERCTAILQQLLEPVARHRVGWNRAPFRVLLLARNSGDWWARLAEREGSLHDLLREDSPEALLPLVPSAEEREGIVRATAAAFADALHRPLPSSPLLPLVDSRYDHLLSLHMAALAWVNELSFTAETLINELLDHEERGWLMTVEDARRAVVGLTLCGGAPSEERARALVRSVNGGVDEKFLLLRLRDLYPGGGEEAFDSPFLRGLEPDLLGDSMVWRTLCLFRDRGDSVEGFLDCVFDGADERALVAGFEVLGRLSADHPDSTRPWIAHLLARDLPGRALPALEASKAIGMRTAHALVGIELATALEREGTVDLAERLAAAGIPDVTVSLREVKAWVPQMLLSRHPGDAESVEMRAERARLLDDLGKAQSDLGQHEAALSSTLAAVDIRRKLAAARPDAFLPDLTMSLNNMGHQQSALGQWEAALASTLEALEIRRKLAAARPAAFAPELAESFNLLGMRQRDLGQPVPALASTREAVEISRKLAAARLDTFLPALAMNLNTLGMTQRDLGQREAALASMLEAVDIRRKLSAVRPDAFLPTLAMSLHNMGRIQYELGQQEEALASTLEAVDIRRKLSAVRPEAFLPYLALSLINMGMVQVGRGKREAALAASIEAVDISRRLSTVRPEAFLPYLALSLHNMGVSQSDLGQQEAALASMLQAVEIRRKLAAARPDAFLPVLALSLNGLAFSLHKLGRNREALPVAQEALDLLWPFYERLPKAHSVVIGAILNNMAALLKTLRQSPDKQWNQRMTRYLALSGS